MEIQLVCILFLHAVCSPYKETRHNILDAALFSNLAIINHSVSEFVVDFIAMMPGAPKAKVKSRIVLTPQHAKKFLKALNDNVARFENAHGKIKDYEQPPIPLNFGPTGEA